MSTELLVLIVRDGGLRSALIARLSLQGESLVTLDVGPEDPLIERITSVPKILVIDTAALGDRLSALVDNGHWDRIIVLADTAEETESSGRVRIVDQHRALAGIIEALEYWRPGRDVTL